MVNGRRMEFAIMRGLGASRGAGVLLLLPGAGSPGPCWAVSWAAWSSPRWGRAGPGWLAAAGFLVSYLIGCALAVLAVGRTKLMSLLSERE